VKEVTDIFTTEKEYTPPKLEVFEAQELLEKLGPVVSCSGYGGATSGCN